MRSHFIVDLDIVGKEQLLFYEGSFDFYRLGAVLSLLIEFPRDHDTSQLPSLTITVEYKGETKNYVLVLRCEEMRELALPRIHQSLSLAEVEIEDVGDRMMEGIRFEIISHFDRSFKCVCRKIKVMEFRPID